MCLLDGSKVRCLFQGVELFRASSESNAPVRNAVSWSTSSCSPARCFCGHVVRALGSRGLARVAGPTRGSRGTIAGHDAGAGCETPAGEACATPASFVWRFQAALNAFWDLGRGADDKSGWFLAGSAALWTLDQLFALGL